jgi:hypothetical protein
VLRQRIAARIVLLEVRSITKASRGCGNLAICGSIERKHGVESVKGDAHEMDDYRRRPRGVKNPSWGSRGFRVWTIEQGGNAIDRLIGNKHQPRHGCPPSGVHIHY